MADFDYIGINVTAAQIERIAGMGINTEQVTENSGNDEIPTSKAVFEGIMGSVEDNYSASSKKAQSGIAVGLAIENSVDKIRYSSGSHEITNVREALDALFEGGNQEISSENVSHSLQFVGTSQNAKEALDAVENYVIGQDFKIQKAEGDILANTYEIEEIKDKLKNIGTSEGIYELIETVNVTEETTILRTAEPDGTPYAFSSMFIQFETTAATMAALRWHFSYVSTGNPTLNVIGHDTTAISNNTGTRRAFVEVEPNRGWWDSKFVDWYQYAGATNLKSTASAGKFTYNTEDAPIINRFSSSGTVPVGTTIKIWGAKA